MLWAIVAATLISTASEDAAEPDGAGTAVVTGTRLPRPLPDDPVPITVIPRGEIARAPTVALDDLVRTVPSASAFRRSSSLVADPSSQGLTLRGIGPSGVSRGLLLVDGVPANDPFGGWVYWRAVPLLSIDHIEVAPGAGSALYGNAAMGGVVQVISRRIGRPSLDADVAAGTHGTYLGALHAAGRQGDLGGALDGEGLTTGGWIPVLPAQRGPADVPATSHHVALVARGDAVASSRLRFELGAGGFLEDEDAGTASSGASVRLGTLRARSHLDTDGGAWEVTAFAALERFDQDRARVSSDRSTAQLAARQHVPASQQGAVITFAPTLAGAGTHELLAGLDVRRVEGTSHEDLFPESGATGGALVGRRAGGEQQFAGVFVQDVWRPGPVVQLSGALRADVWRNADGERLSQRGDGTETLERFPTRTEVQLAPRFGVLYRPSEVIALRAAAYRSFRAPSLNELYRPFQVGTVVTDANPDLAVEQLTGGEIGVDLFPVPGISLRWTAFWNHLARPIVNVTLSSPSLDGATRQRQNLGAARIPGIETTVAWRPSPHWTAIASYTYIVPRVSDAPQASDLVGKDLAQDPRHRGTATVVFDHPRLFTAEVEVRGFGLQFEDDRNALPMAGYVVVGASLARRIVRGLEAYVAGENLLDRTYLVGRAGVDTIGSPRLVRAGVRMQLGR